MLQQTNSTEYALIADQLSLSFGSKKALDQISLKIPSRGVTALLGANGAGKTSLINCALGLRKAQTGSLTILGEVPGSKTIKPKLGVMLQEAQLPDLLTPTEHLELYSSYFNDAHEVDHIIELCQLSEFKDRRYKVLSGGQKRRVLFAVAVIGKPKFLFLDEPTTGLDIEARHFLWQTIRQLSSAGTAILLTTHYLEEADMLCDNVVLIDNGKIAATGKSNDIRRLVSGSLVCVRTQVDTDVLKGLPGVSEVRELGRLVELSTSEVNQTLSALLKLDPDLEDLSISAPSLEHAFVKLSSDSAGAN